MKKFESLPDNAKQLFTRDLNRGRLPDLEDNEGNLNPNSVVEHSNILNNLLETYGTKGYLQSSGRSSADILQRVEVAHHLFFNHHNLDL